MNPATKLLAGVAIVVVVACTSTARKASPVAAEGPPRVDVELVRRHAAQFDEELTPRAAGSQEEEAAAAYILGHLQRAGYVARLEAVPVANTVNSTDVIAMPPSGDAPEAVVAVAYDSGAGVTKDGTSIGLFLELARALAAARPQHSVGFAALGAERTDVGGGHLGSRRLARLLLDESQSPYVITIERLGGPVEGRFGAFGEDVDPLVDVARRLDIPVVPLPGPDPAAGRDLSGRAEVFSGAGLEHAAVTGGPREVGRVLLEYLA